MSKQISAKAIYFTHLHSEIKALKKEIEELKKRLVVSSLDANIEDEPEPAKLMAGAKFPT